MTYASTVAQYAGIAFLIAFFMVRRRHPRTVEVLLRRLRIRQVVDVDAAADDLAAQVEAQWRKEAARRQLDAPPLPVSWKPAPRDLWQPLPFLANLTRSAPGWMPPPDAITSPDGLRGTGRDLVEVVTRVPTRRLVLLGGSGSGKTALLIGLVLDLLGRRPPGAIVPIVVNMSSWDPARYGFESWLERAIERDHPYLGRTRDGKPAVKALVEAGFILPLLDGLDEIETAARRLALENLNEALRPGMGIVVSCRVNEFREVTRPPQESRADPLLLAGAAAIVVEPLAPSDVGRYLADTAGGGKARWASVIQAVEDPSPVRAPAARALATPLMVRLARHIYNSRSGDRAEPPDPNELVDEGRYPSREAVERHLLTGLIAAAYRAGSRTRASQRPEQAHRYLAYLAYHLDFRLRADRLAWWEVAQAIPSALYVAGGALLAAAAVGFLIDGLSTGVVPSLLVIAVGATFGATVGQFLARRHQADVGLTDEIGRWLIDWINASQMRSLTFLIGNRLTGGWLRRQTFLDPDPPVTPAMPARLSVRRPRRSDLVAGIVIGAVAGIFLSTYGVVHGEWEIGVFMGSVVAIGLAAVLSTRLSVVSDPGSYDVTPGSALARDRSAVLLRGLAAGLVMGISAGLAEGEESGVFAGLWKGALWAVVVGALVAGLGGLGSTWAAFGLARLWLAATRRTPLRLMAFLADARERGVLRHSGSSYEFVHAELRHLLAQTGRQWFRPAPRPSRERIQRALADSAASAAVPAGGTARPARTRPAARAAGAHPAGRRPGRTPGAARSPAAPPPVAVAPSAGAAAPGAAKSGTLAYLRDAVGPDHTKTLALAEEVAREHRGRGEFQAAWRLDDDVLRRRSRLLGADHPDTLAAAENLARDLSGLGDGLAARTLYEDVLSRKRRVLGPDTLSTLQTAALFADTLWELGERSLARATYEETLRGMRALLGDDHATVLILAARFADVLRALGEAGSAHDLVSGAQPLSARWDFFVSYTGRDARWAEWIAWQLEDGGYRVLFQKWDMVVGSNWMITMQDGMVGSERTMAVLSDAYLRSVFGQHEWQAAVRADPHGFNRKLVPVRIEPCDRPGILGGIVSFDLFGLDEDAARGRLLREVETLRGGRGKPEAPPTFPDSGRPARQPRFPGDPAQP